MFGILTVNIWWFASAAARAGLPVNDSQQVVQSVIAFLFAGKSYVLFAFLFGYSFVLQDSGPRFVKRMTLRLVGLIVLGLLHAALLFVGDILVTYGILGFLLLAMRAVRPRVAVRRGILLTAVGGVFLILLGALFAVAGEGAAGGSAEGLVEQVLAGYTAGPASVVASNLSDPQLPGTLLFQGLPALGAMLFGAAAARSGVLRDAAVDAAVWRRLAVWGPIVGLIGAAVMTVMLSRGTSASGTSASVLVGLGVGTLTAPLLTATYVALIVAWQRRAPGSAFLRGINSVGRIALTNYLFQSLAMAVVFTGYGFGLMETLSGLQIVGVILAIYTVQVVASTLWLRSHRYGPAEWLLRRLTLVGG